MHRLAALFLYGYLWLVFHTSRWEKRGYDVVLKNANAQKRQIYVFWHGRMAMMPFFKPTQQDTYLIASRHKDGQLIGKVMDYFDIHIIEGSSRRKGSNKDRGGRQALVMAIKRLKENTALAITPDGPRGPCMRVSGHVVEIAKKTEAVIIPMSFSATCGKLFHSWDRFFLPLPFGKMVYLAADAIAVPADANAETIEKIRQKLEDDLNVLTYQADTLTRRKEIPEPASIS